MTNYKILAWFLKPKTMSAWLYVYFAHKVQPLVMNKDRGRDLIPLKLYSSRTSFWLYPSEPCFALRYNHFDPVIHYRPRIFLWLPHFLVDEHRLHCPTCKEGILEKNGALAPRTITDVDTTFYIVTWSYYCRKGCQSWYSGYNQSLLESLPAYIRLAFPAVLSQKRGLSHNVISQLCIGNQHKMGLSGVRSLLNKTHTLHFNHQQLQYLEAVFEQVQHIESREEQKNKIDGYLALQSIRGFGNFGDREGYAGFVLSEHYLSEMMNRIIEREEADADQHTSCLVPDQLAIDNSHKVLFAHSSVCNY